MPDNPRDFTPLSRPLGAAAILVRLAVIGVVVLLLALAFAFTGGWFSKNRLTPEQVVKGFEQVNGQHPGFRRNHAKGVCATGYFESNGNAATLSKAALFAPGRVPVVGRIAFAGGMPFIPDAPDTVRSLALRFQPAGAEEWRTGMINIPVFPVRTARAFYDQMISFAPDPATGKPDPAKMKAFTSVHPEFVAAVGLLGKRQVSSGFADTTYNGIDTFRFVDANGTATQVRWSTEPVAPFVAAPKDGAPLDKNALFDAFIAQVAQHPVQWHLVVVVGEAGDPASPDLPWPDSRRKIDAGVVTIDKLASEDEGPCTDVNFDPMVLPAGIEASDDPIPSARSAAYARSFTLREGERGEKPPSAVTPQEVHAGDKS
jgi:catalase